MTTLRKAARRLFSLLMLGLLFSTGAAHGQSAPPGPSAHSFVVTVTGHGRPMILIPGLASSGETWDSTVATTPTPQDAAFLDSDRQVFVRDGERCWVVALKKIVLMESEGNYTRMNFEGNRPLLLRSLGDLQARLVPQSSFAPTAGRLSISNSWSPSRRGPTKVISSN